MGREDGSGAGLTFGGMTIEYTTKAESNRRREEAFLALSGEERFAEFLYLSRLILREYPSSLERDYGSNLVLTRRADWREARAGKVEV